MPFVFNPWTEALVGRSAIKLKKGGEKAGFKSGKKGMNH